MHKLQREFGRYLVVSVIAFLLDVGLLLLLAAHVHYLIAAAISFLAGSVAHYLLAIKLVFKTRRMIDKKHLEALVYLATGLFGILVNTIIIYLGVEWLEATLLLSKLTAAGASLITGYTIRKLILFRADAARHVHVH